MPAQGFSKSSELVRNVLLEDFTAANIIVDSEDFDPNEISGSNWASPVVSSIISLVNNFSKMEDKESFKELLKKIVSKKGFDPNKADNGGDTVLMHIAKKKEYAFLMPIICKNCTLNLDRKTYVGKTALDIAKRYENEEFINAINEYMKSTDFYKGMPVKHCGIKKDYAHEVKPKEKKPIDVSDAFTREQKLNPVSSFWALKAFLEKNYDKCLEIISDEKFNPNEKNNWEEPFLTSLIYYSQDNRVEYDEEKFKDIASAIISKNEFNVNVIDANGDSVIMASMYFTKLKWLTKKLYISCKVNPGIVNDLGLNLRGIAKNMGAEEFLNRMSLQVAETN